MDDIPPWVPAGAFAATLLVFLACRACRPAPRPRAPPPPPARPPAYVAENNVAFMRGTFADPAQPVCVSAGDPGVIANRMLYIYQPDAAAFAAAVSKTYGCAFVAGASGVHYLAASLRHVDVVAPIAGDVPIAFVERVLHVPAQDVMAVANARANLIL